VLLGWLLLGEGVGALQFVGIAVVLASMGILLTAAPKVRDDLA
jgi:drug/metabolite transporter (DMT)-like permease